MQDMDVPHNIQLADPTFNVKGPIELLLGARIFYQVIEAQQKRFGRGPTFQNSKFGWLACGLLQQKENDSCGSPIFQESTLGWIAQTPSSHTDPTTTTLKTDDSEPDESTYPEDELDKLIKKFWQLEEAAEPESQTTALNINEVENHFRSTMKVKTDGRYVVRIPLRGEISSLGESHSQAHRRFLGLERRLVRNQEIYQEYRKFMQEYESMGHLEPISDEDFNRAKYFIPHSCVIKPDSTSTKLRVVFDASAKTSSGVSLNGIQVIGPTIQKDLFDQLIEFKTHNKVLMGDIAKMYRQVEVAEEDTWLQCILWRNQPSEPIKAFRLTTVTYGEAASSFLACRALYEAGEDYRDTDPEIADLIQRSFYVDNLMIGASTTEELQRMKGGIQDALLRHGFPLRKWASNDLAVLDGIPPQDLEPLIQMGDQEIIKTLGVAWNPTHDVFQFISSEKERGSPRALTKRQMVSKVLRLYDPLGLVQPVIVTAKILVQQLWNYRLNWDDEVPSEAIKSWNEFESSLTELQSIGFPRMTTPSRTIVLDLHGFSDASGKAYGCVIYLHAINLKGNESTTLLCSKSRVAPLKGTTLPRLELQAAVLLAELSNRIKGILEKRITSEHYYSDSQVTLSWIKSHSSRWDTFIKNRVNKIHNYTNPNDWDYVSTKENPADMVSRGIPVKKLINSKLDFWLHGPAYIQHREWYPRNGYQYDAAAETEQKKRSATALVISQGSEYTDYITEYPHHNSYHRTVRHFAWLSRAINNLRTIDANTGINHRRSGPLTKLDLDQGLELVIQTMQNTIYPNEMRDLRKTGVIPTRGAFEHLKVKAERGILRVTGRLQNAAISDSEKTPMLVPKSHPFARVIIRNIHEKRFHAGMNLVMNEFRLQFWMRDLRRTVQGVIQHCVSCARARPRKLYQETGQLPTPRVNESAAFTHTGVDLCGPFTVLLNQRSKCKVNAYACIFVCFATKAVHLEVVEDQSAAAFISALLRFTSIRGVPEVVYSDNGRNFVGASSELNRLRKAYNNQNFQNKIIDTAAKNGIHFSFIPPRSPNFGGLWESNIKVAKRLFSAAARGAQLNIMELQTLFYQVAAIMNSRPLTAIYAAAEIPTPLTPGHFLIGRPMQAIPMPTQPENTVNLTTRWKRVQHQLEQFWRRWRDEYLHQLRDYAKWTKQQTNVKIGQIVLIGDDHVPIARWPMGTVTQVYPGEDGIVRVAVVRTAAGVYKRNVRTLAPLPIEHEANREDVNTIPTNEERSRTADNESQLTPETNECEEDPPPQAPAMIWDGRLRPRPKGGRKWK
ncbi:uncharacterized protein LOC134222276 [Armigeres subalbatus]|uniref:uncharacterized protein LOC134222276 n=1 Tax=Armigeres subalbatus TaxID=124917 RepID=UPI002ED476FF